MKMFELVKNSKDMIATATFVGWGIEEVPKVGGDEDEPKTY